MTPEHIDVTATDRLHLPGDCAAVSSVLARVGDKWSVLVIMQLAAGPRRFNEIKRMIGGVSQRMLTLTLRGLERDGLVTRTIYPTIPPRVDYELTKLGQSLRAPVENLGNWVFKNLPRIHSARAKFDSSGNLVGARSDDDSAD
ncbi:MAG: transcriptional regulator [Bradyrhizobiaceae bacterium]|nr:MAG: transcriptional regulator [Bradyrhizobiaceae bacterium]